MRKLYIVPIHHMSADMGALASLVDETEESRMGREAWQEHKKAISGFWDCIARFFEPLDVKGFRLYQDGMVADGEEALRIVREGSLRGSKNSQLVEKLVERGAILMKTEQLALVEQEYAYVAKIARAESFKEKETWALRYRLAQSNLLRQRDMFIARRINETLGQSETGILLIGANHKILPFLPDDLDAVIVDRTSAISTLPRSTWQSCANNGHCGDAGR